MLLEGGGTFKEVSSSGRKLGHWGHAVEKEIGSSAPSSPLPGLYELSRFAPPCAPLSDILPHHRPRVMGLTHHELKPWKP